MKIIIGTRFFERDPGKIEIIEKFVHRALDCADRVLVAVNTEEDKTGALNHKKLKLPGVQVFGINPWGKFIPALNTLIYKARAEGADALFLASAEMKFAPQHFWQLQSYLEKDTLVAGAVMEGHDFKEGERFGNGRTVPWNTFSLWNLEHLSKTGFPLVSDAFIDGKNAGVEEVTTIAVLQKIYPRLTAKLINLSGIERDKSRWDAWRLKRHKEEMRKRLLCPAAQMKILKIPSPRIIHINQEKQYEK